MKKTERCLAAGVTLILSILLVVLFLPTGSKAAGPWKGQIVDKETGKPIEEAVVLAVWMKATGIFHTTGGSEFYDSEETVTDAEGHFFIHARQTWTLNPFSRIYGPEFYILKSGYGRWQFRDFDKWGLKDAMVSAERTRAEWRRFTAEGSVLELPQLKTREERLRMSSYMAYQVPANRMPKFLEAINKELASLGLQPVEPR